MNKQGRLRLGILMLAGIAVAPAAIAGPQEEAAAEALFLEGKKLLERGKYDEACLKLAESLRIDPAVGTLLYLGECYARNGQLASAWATFQSAGAAARTANQPERLRIATERANQLLPRAPKVAISVSPPRPAGLEVTRDGSIVGEAAWGEAVPVDPGEHVIAARAPGKKAWSATVEVRSGAVTRVEIPALEDATAGDALFPSTIPGIAPGVTTATTPSIATPNSGAGHGVLGTEGVGTTTAPSHQRTFAYVAGGAGVGGVALGIAFGILAKNKEHDSEAYCRADNPALCGRAGLDLLDDAKTAATAANISFLVGGVALATGAVLYLTAPRPSGTYAGVIPPGPSAYGSEQHITAVVRALPNGIEVAGAF